MRQTVELRGLAAAPGFAVGPLFPIDPIMVALRPPGDKHDEIRALREAIAVAVATIRRLAATADDDAAEILEFQIAVLEDQALIESALDRIAKGIDAASAWGEAIEVQIADYSESDSDYFRGRATDLQDLRDRVTRALAGIADAPLPAGAVLTGGDVTPTQFLSVDWTKGGGIALRAGSPSSHVAMLARARRVPMVVGLGDIDLAGHETAIVDGDSGRILLSPAERDRTAYGDAQAVAARQLARETAAARDPAITADNVPVAIMLNVAGPDELGALDPAICDGIGLVRTEFLFHAGIPDEDTQFRAYRRIIDWAAGRPVVLRTLDAGGDKPIAGLTVPGESNPFLGTRGIRLSLARPDIFRVQLRALVRAAALGDVRIMLPMVTVPAELAAAAELLDGAVNNLSASGVPCRRPPLGMMVEVPAAAVEPQLFARADFFSIGSNDLTQYVTASARDNSTVAALCDPGHPAVLSLIARVVEAGKRLGRPVSLCGDMGSDPAHIPALLAAGVRTLSVAPALVGRTKLAIAIARVAQ